MLNRHISLVWKSDDLAIFTIDISGTKNVNSEDG